ncbi:uncharacterized protein PHA67_005423 [Liasis olivaceus]
MAWALLFLALLSSWSGINSQPTLTQPPYMSVSQGQTIKLSCTVSSNQNTIYWYQQKVGQRPRYVHYSWEQRRRDPGSVHGFCLWEHWLFNHHRQPGSRRGHRVLSVLTIMSLILLLFPVLVYCSGADSQPVLTQDPSQSVALRNTARLVCSLSRGCENYVISWYQQKAGQNPRLVLDTNGNRGEGIPDRFSGSKSGSDRFLTITNVQAEDEAIYYCGADHGSGGGGLDFNP